MKNLLRLEETAIFALSLVLFSYTSFEWWWFPLLIFLPDIGMVGYLFNTRIGAITYNFFHHKAVAITVLFTGWYLVHEWTMLAGIILLGHLALDRILGYGLKYSDSFQHTHLGWINEEKKQKTVA